MKTEARPFRIIVNGARGKMGALACQTLTQNPSFQLVGALGREDNLHEAIAKTKADIVVDLTTADSVFTNTKTIIEGRAHPVIGTSGLHAEQIQALQAQCEASQLGGLIVPNFSISAVLMMQFAAQAARWLPQAEIIETHHMQKLDAPSGTAMKTAEMIAKARHTPPTTWQGRVLLPGATGALYQEVPIHSLRLPGVIARQEVWFGSTGETLTLTHNTLDRAAFMPGLILACQAVTTFKSLYYGLEHALAHSSI